MASYLFKFRYSTQMICSIIIFIASWFFENNFLEFYMYEILTLRGLPFWIILILGGLTIFILALITAFSSKTDRLATTTEISFIIYFSSFALFFLIQNQNIPLMITSGNLIVLFILGTNKINNNQENKLPFIIKRNFICNVLVIVLNIALILCLLLIEQKVNIIFYLIFIILNIIFSILNLIFKKASPQKYLFSLDKKKMLIQDNVAKIASNIQQVNRKIIEIIIGILVTILVISLFVYGITELKINYSQNSEDLKFDYLIGFLIVESLILGIIIFLEIINQIEFKEISNKHPLYSKYVGKLNSIKEMYKGSRSQTLVLFISSAVAAVFCLIVTISITNWSIFGFNRENWTDFRSYSYGAIDFFNILLIPFMIIIGLILLVILLLGLFAPGYITKNPIGGFLGGIITGWVYFIFLALFEYDLINYKPVVILAFILPPIFNSLIGFLFWRFDGKPGLQMILRKSKLISRGGKNE